MVIQVCVGSSCHLKGSADVVELLQKAVEQHNLEADVVLSGCFWFFWRNKWELI